MNKPTWKHDCEDCVFLGQTIGGGHVVDLYAHPSKQPGDIARDATVIARYSDDGPDYCSTVAQSAHPEGHAELFAAATLWQRKMKY